MDCTVTPLKTLMGFSVHLNVQLKFYNLPNHKKGLKIGEKRLPVGFHYANLNNEMIRTPRNYFVNFGPLKINIH